MDCYDDYDMDIVPMKKSELALLYAPNLTPHAAVNRLMTWVKHDKQLMAELLGTGYRKTAKLLSAMQVGLIVEHLGLP